MDEYRREIEKLKTVKTDEYGRKIERNGSPKRDRILAVLNKIMTIVILSLGIILFILGITEKMDGMVIALIMILLAIVKIIVKLLWLKNDPVRWKEFLEEAEREAERRRREGRFISSDDDSGLSLSLTNLKEPADLTKHGLEL